MPHRDPQQMATNKRTALNVLIAVGAAVVVGLLAYSAYDPNKPASTANPPVTQPK